MPPRSKQTAGSTPAGVRQQAPTREEAAAARRDAFDGVKPTDRGMVEALLVERRGYETRGLTDRVAEVDAQLRLRGYRTA